MLSVCAICVLGPPMRPHACGEKRSTLNVFFNCSPSCFLNFNLFSTENIMTLLLLLFPLPSPSYTLTPAPLKFMASFSLVAIVRHTHMCTLDNDDDDDGIILKLKVDNTPI